MTTTQTPYIPDHLRSLDNVKRIVADRKRLHELNEFEKAYVLGYFETARDILSELEYPPGSNALLVDGSGVTVVTNDGVWGATVRDAAGHIRHVQGRFLRPDTRCVSCNTTKRPVWCGACSESANRNQHDVHQGFLLGLGR